VGNLKFISLPDHISMGNSAFKNYYAQVQCSVVEWSGVEWSGVWSGVEWSGVKWNGVECSVV
jgi:hypothetical protein